MPPTTPGSTRRVSGASAGPNLSEAITATGRAPMARMSRTIPPTPVAAPWKGSTYDGGLCDSSLNVTAYPWPMSTTPAFWPIPASSAVVGGGRGGTSRAAVALPRAAPGWGGGGPVGAGPAEGGAPRPRGSGPGRGGGVAQVGALAAFHPQRPLRPGGVTAGPGGRGVLHPH